MELLLQRTSRGSEYTIGKLYVNGAYQCDTLEDKDRGLSSSQSLQDIQNLKVYGKTAIPVGAYKIDMDTISPKFRDRSWARICRGKLPRLIDVKGYEGVLIHVGNKAEDTLGCILVGSSTRGDQLIGSTPAFEALYKVMSKAHLRSEEITITIQ